MLSIQKQKAEKFINKMFQGMDDPVMEQIMRCQYLGDDESKLDELIKKQQKEMEEYASHFELQDATKTVLTNEEKEEILREQSSITSVKNPSSNK